MAGPAKATNLNLWPAPTELQRHSTVCALCGSGMALLAAVVGVEQVDELPIPCSRLEFAALLLISGSLLMELAAYCQRQNGRQSRRPSDASSQRSGPVRKALSILRPIGLAALAMGCCTAMGKGVAYRLGIVPRTWSGLPGVVFGCFVHLSWPHFGWNALALFLLGPCVLLASSSTGDISSFAVASVFIAITSGLCVWCLARPALHAGASGMACGYLGLLLALVLRRKDLPLGTLLLVLGVVACYGSALLLHRPMTGGRLLLYEACMSRSTSAEHHTFGFLSGLASAIFFCRPARTDDRSEASLD